MEHDQPYSLPEVLCSSSSVVKLNYENCRILEDSVLNWTSLKSLTQEDLFHRDKHIKQILSNCPLLEFLKLCEFCGFNQLHMTSTNVGDWNLSIMVILTGIGIHYKVIHVALKLLLHMLNI
ncbi:hypothetical protein RDI58_028909 [Solanum bulbocastanum]|uniref:F-box/LRR-repeat protein 15/At3g58940/PEG3-like LRR domain-containing protein n=1 Tax=Solanum bulbocastanum TaxID=147425 RepID=A0AAN8SVD0_SOLBU